MCSVLLTRKNGALLDRKINHKNMRLKLMYPHVTTYKLWAELDENNTSTNAKYQPNLQILLHKKGMSKIRPLDMYIYILVVEFQPQRNTMSQATDHFFCHHK